MPSVKVSKNPVGRPALIQAPIVAWMVDVGTWAIQYLSKNNRIATGKSINSFYVDIKNNPTDIQLLAASSVKWALQGRNAGKPPPVFAIDNWIRAKGFARGETEQTINSIAWAIRTKIANEGTNQPRLKPQNITLVVKSKGKKHLEQIGQNIGQDIAFQMVEKLTGKKE